MESILAEHFIHGLSSFPGSRYTHENSASNNEIAGEMHISVHTAETHRRSIVATCASWWMVWSVSRTTASA